MDKKIKKEIEQFINQVDDKILIENLFEAIRKYNETKNMITIEEYIKRFELYSKKYKKDNTK